MCSTRPFARRIGYFLCRRQLGKPDLLAVHGREIFTRKPGLGMIGLVSLGHQLGYFNILPLYIVLLVSAPAMLWLATIDRWLDWVSIWSLGASTPNPSLRRMGSWDRISSPTRDDSF